MHRLIASRGGSLRPDVVAGLTTAAVVIPKAMAYATVAGLPVEAGLYTAFVPLVIYAVLGSSRVLSVTTTTTIAILVAAQLAQLAPDGDPAAALRVSTALALLVLAVPDMLSVGVPLWLSLPLNVLLNGIVVFALVRYGLLAGVVTLYVVNWLLELPITADVASWTTSV